MFMNVIEKVKTTITEYNLLEREDSVLVALSGGPDSVALLSLLAHLKKRFKLQVYALYINHNIRKRAAKKEERFCQTLCEQLRVKLFIVFGDIPLLSQLTKKGLEETARNFRYATFERFCREYHIDKVALGHHKDDRVETILFRILRGTGRTGLQGIPIKRDKFIRPLYNLTKSEIIDFLNENNLSYCLDQSNFKIDFKRNFIRHKLLPTIRKNLNPMVDNALINLSETSSDEEIFLNRIVQKQLKKVMFKTVGGKIEIVLKNFGNYDRWLRKRLLRSCLTDLSEVDGTPDKIVVDRLDKLCILGGKGISLPNKIQAVLLDDKLVLFKKRAKGYKQVLNENKKYNLEQLNLKISLRVKKEVRLKKQRQAKTVLLDKSKIIPPLYIRNIKPGDKFKPLGLKGTKKVGNYLTDRKVDKIYRDEIPVLCDKQGIIWLVGYEIDDRVKITQATKEVLEIEVTQRQ
ncbi:MAG: tRNA lysidine(34) synthetase TilS [FCB group bacterium]|nr:tRNA lysidine(34) synthetase TilS [FCB group bacterium]